MDNILGLYCQIRLNNIVYITKVIIYNYWGWKFGVGINISGVDILDDGYLWNYK
jgi:hypothetical protein